MESLFDEAKKIVSELTVIPGRQAYFLDVPGTDSAAQLSVVSFTGTEEMGEPNTLRIVLTHPHRLPRADYLNRDAAFRIVPDDGRVRKFSGYIERFSTIQTTKDFVKYEIVLKSHLGRLAAVTNSQIYQHQSTPEILEAVMRRHDMRPEQYAFRLRRRYPTHVFRFQYRMTDLAYAQMMMQRAGIYCYTVETEHGDQVVFADDIDHYLYDPQLIAPYREAAGLEAGGKQAVTSLQTHTIIVPQSIVVADYNPESAWERFRDTANIAPQDETTYGQPYFYGTHHLDQEGAKWEAQLRHEAAIARQVVYEGKSNVLELQCARVLEMDVALPDAPSGQVIVKVTHSGARDKPYTNGYEAIPADRRFRLELKPQTWAKIAGTLSARITSPDRYKYAYLTASGHYPVRFDIDFADWPKGGESVPLRLAKPFAGKLQTGMHFVALDGDEAVISFRDGDPDKPEITAFHHHSQARDLVTNDRRWLSRNVIRTQSNNKLRMEDWAGQEGIKLSTEHSGKSQLNLGYLVNQKLECRGEGYELRTSGYGVERAGQGLLVTTYDRPAATGSRLPLSAGAEDERGKDGSVVVTAVKLREALRQRWLASELSHVILKYESEWGGGMSRWEALTPLMRDAAENWKCELERIRKLQWWDSVKGKVEGFAGSAVVNHIHPVALVENFLASYSCINIDTFCEEYKILHATEFGAFDKHGKHISINQINQKSERNLKSLVTEMMRQYPLIFSECNISYLAYMLSTARTESYDWQHGIFFGPIVESISYSDAEANYGCGPGATPKHKQRAIRMGNAALGDGYKYRGRGLVQLTFKKNYQKFNLVAGADLEKNPEKTLELPVSVRIMMLGMRDGMFSGSKLSDFLDSPTPDYIGARSIINGNDKADQFAFYAQKFEQLINATR